MDGPTRTQLSSVALTTLCAGLVAILVLLIVADISVDPIPPVRTVPLAADHDRVRPSGWFTVGGLEAGADQRWIAQSLPAPGSPVDFSDVVLNIAAASGSTEARLIVDVYQTSSIRPSAAALRLARGTVGVTDLKPGPVHLVLDKVVHAIPDGRWYTFVLRTSEPGAAATVALLPDRFDRAAMWSTSTSDLLAVLSGRVTSWTAEPGSRLLLLLNSVPGT
jgi:hypothetical protein